MRRRELIMGAGVAAIFRPCAARAQQNALPIIGFLSSRSPEDSKPQIAGFRQGLAEMGFVEGENLAIEYRWARGDYDRLPALAAELPPSRCASSQPSAVSPRLWRQRRQRRQSRSSLRWAAILSRPAL